MEEALGTHPEVSVPVRARTSPRLVGTVDLGAVEVPPLPALGGSTTLSSDDALEQAIAQLRQETGAEPPQGAPATGATAPTPPAPDTIPTD
eukprot:14961709-Alexandrium_andersonii.AAC.1